MNKFYSLSFFCLWLAAIGFCSLVFGQVQEKEATLQYDVSVTLKLIQVFVSDRDGKPVQGLTKEDFRLYDNGRLMTISDFEAHGLSLPPEKNAAPPPRLSRKFFLFLDAYRNDGMGLKKARTTAQHFIDTQIQPEDELGLLTYSIDRGLVLHMPLTTDHDKIREAISKVRLFPSMTALNNGVTAMEEALDFVESLSDFAVSLRYIPGYKHILLFSAGFPRALLESEDPRLRYEHERLAKELASSSSPIFTVDTQGTRDLVGGREQKGDHSLRRLASLTGGRHFVNVDYRDPISEDIQNSTGNFYVLGYSVDETWDGKYHEIRVEVERKGVRVQAQKGYFNPKPFNRFSKLEKRLHLLDLARNPSPRFDLPKIIPSVSRLWSDSGSWTVLHLVELTPSDLEDILSDKNELFTLVYDEEGVLTDEGQMDLDLSENPPERICIYTSFQKAPGLYDFFTVLRNKKTGAAARAQRSVVLPSAEETHPILYGPVLFVPGSQTLCLSMETEPVKGQRESSDFNLEVLAPRLEGPVSPQISILDKDTNSLFAVFGQRDEAEEIMGLEFSARLLSAGSGDVFPLVMAERKDIKTERPDTLVCELEKISVPPGQYVLEMSVSGFSLPEKLVFTQYLSVR